jgi:LysR family hydrogen peroxide-inducible transcriptional activator
MEFHQLEYFLAVAKYRSFTKAAEEINVSQSSLSIQIGKLESEFGVRLFERTTRSLFLTTVGKEFLPFAERIMEDSKKAKVMIEQFISADKGNILIGAFPGSQYFGFIELVSQFKFFFPDIHFDIFESECAGLVSALKALEIDVAFLTHFHETEGIHFYPLYEDHLVLAVNKDHPFASRNSVILEELTNEALIFNVETTLYANVTEIFNRLGLCPNIVLRTHGHLSSTLGFVSSGFGATMISSRVAEYYAHRGLAFLDIQPAIPRTTYLAVPTTHEKRPIINNFVKFVLHNLKPKDSRANLSI